MKALIVFSIVALLLLNCKSSKEDEYNVIAKDFKGEKLAQVGDRVLNEEMIRSIIPPEEYMKMNPDMKKKIVNQWVDVQLIRLEALSEGFPKNRRERLQYQLEKDGNLSMSFLRAKISSYEPDAKELQEYYDKNIRKYTYTLDMYKIKQIFYKTKEEAVSALSKIKTDDDFTKLSRVAPDDPNAAETKGEQGYMSEKQLYDTYGKDLSTKITAINKGNYLFPEPLQIINGFLVIKITGYRAKGSQTPFDEVRAEIFTDLKKKKAESYGDEYIKKLKSKYSYINVLEKKGN
jgi:hypothetical protein